MPLTTGVFNLKFNRKPENKRDDIITFGRVWSRNKILIIFVFFYI